MATSSMNDWFRFHDIAIQQIKIRCPREIARCANVERAPSASPFSGYVNGNNHSSIHIGPQTVILTLVDGIRASVPYYRNAFASRRPDESHKQTKGTLAGGVPSATSGPEHNSPSGGSQQSTLAITAIRSSTLWLWRFPCLESEPTEMDSRRDCVDRSRCWLDVTWS